MSLSCLRARAPAFAYGSLLVFSFCPFGAHATRPDLPLTFGIQLLPTAVFRCSVSRYALSGAYLAVAFTLRVASSAFACGSLSVFSISLRSGHYPTGESPFGESTCVQHFALRAQGIQHLPAAVFRCSAFRATRSVVLTLRWYLPYGWLLQLLPTAVFRCSAFRPAGSVVYSFLPTAVFGVQHSPYGASLRSSK